MLILAEVLQQGVLGPLNEKQLENLQNIEESGRHLLALITEILDVVKINAGKLELDISTVSVRALCESSLRMITAIADKKRIDVTLNVAADVDDIDADDRRLKQMLVNLLSNAVKFTPEGGRRAGRDGRRRDEYGRLHRVGHGHRHRRAGHGQALHALRSDRQRLSRQYEGSGWAWP